jgi:hypothetical protein
MRFMKIVLLTMLGIAMGCSSGHKVSGSERISGGPRVTPEQYGVMVPAEAQLVEQGTGDKSFRADRAGRVWAWDDDRKLVIYTGELSKGDRFTIAPRMNRASINGQQLTLGQQMMRDNVHKIYFLPASE